MLKRVTVSLLTSPAELNTVNAFGGMFAVTRMLPVSAAGIDMIPPVSTDTCAWKSAIGSENKF